VQVSEHHRGWERYGWPAGIVFVAALVAEVVVSIGIPLSQDDSAAKIAHELYKHRERILVVASLSIVYALAFLIYLAKLHDLLARRNNDRAGFLGSFVLVGGTLFVTLHAVSDIGIYGLLGGKLAAYSAHHDPGLSYTLYLLTYALDSVGDVLGSLFLLATGLLVFRSGVLPRWLAWTAMLTGTLFVVQGFGLGGVIATFGLVVDLIGFLGLLIFVVASSIIALRREKTVLAAAGV
jgi:Domain of unknown function (DUF4386)